MKWTNEIFKQNNKYNLKYICYIYNMVTCIMNRAYNLYVKKIACNCQFNKPSRNVIILSIELIILEKESHKKFLEYRRLYWVI